MPDSEYDVEEVREQLKKVQPDPPPCPFCEKTEWELQSEGGELPGLDSNILGITFLKFPVAVLICHNCGYTMLFSTRVLQNK
jgi:predicted nucleic-acid-binding Zn-ribbon protein